MSLGRVRLLLSLVIVEERVLFVPGNPATFKILSLLSDIICMIPSFVCHCFSSFWLCSPREILRKSSLPSPTRGWLCQWIFKSLQRGFVVGSTCHDRLELRVFGTGVPRQHHWWLNVIHFGSITSCFTTGLIIFSVIFVLPKERWHTSLDYSAWANWRKLGTRIWINNFCHHESTFLMIPWWGGSSSGFLNLCVSAVSRIPLVMSGILFFALSIPLSGEHISWRSSTGQLKSVQRNGES